MKVNTKYIYLFLAGAVGLTLASCAEDDLATSKNSEKVGLSITVSQEGYSTGPTRTAYTGYTTTFSTGDAIGVYAVKDGEVVDNISNHQFMLRNGEWENQGKDIEYDEDELAQMTFYAYYPYYRRATFDPTAEDPFAEYLSTWEIGNDQESKFADYDFMSGTGQVRVNRLKGGVIEFTLKHRMALIAIEPPTTIYSFTNSGMEDLILPVTMGSFILNGTDTIQPRYDGELSMYQMLVKPDEEYTLRGTYETPEANMQYEASGVLSAGCACQYTIGGESGDKIEMTLEVGDYIVEGGYLKKASEEPEDAIAVIYSVGDPRISTNYPDFVTTNYPKADGPTEFNYPDLDALSRDYPNAVHGLAMCIWDTPGNYEIDGGMGMPLSMQGSAAGLYSDLITASKYEEYGYYDSHVNANTDNRAEGLGPSYLWPGNLGYNNTKLLIDYIDVAGSKYGCDTAYVYIKEWREKVPLPPSYTPWYLPCWQDWQDYIAVKYTCAASISAVNGDAFDPETTPYWTSNERNAQYQWCSPPDFQYYLRERGSGAQMMRLGLTF